MVRGTSVIGRFLMITRQRKQSPLRRLWMPLLTAGFLGYFGFHAFSGSFGILAMDRLKIDGDRLKAQLDQLKDEHEALERRVSYMRPDSLDADMVDVEARQELNVMRPDELLISFDAVQHRPQ
jgi:cell division protein FtsB